MAIDAGLKRQLIAARERITTQLVHLEGASIDPCSWGGSPDSRGVYAELQEELREIDDLLGSDAGGSEPAYQPMATFAAPQAQWMWRFRGMAAGQIALLAIGWATIFALPEDGTSLLATGGSFAAVGLASAWMATKSRGRELRLFLSTLAIGTGSVGAMLLLADLIA